MQRGAGGVLTSMRFPGGVPGVQQAPASSLELGKAGSRTSLVNRFASFRGAEVFEQREAAAAARTAARGTKALVARKRRKAVAAHALYVDAYAHVERDIFAELEAIAGSDETGGSTGASAGASSGASAGASAGSGGVVAFDTSRLSTRIALPATPEAVAVTVVDQQVIDSAAQARLVLATMSSQASDGSGTTAPHAL